MKYPFQFLSLTIAMLTFQSIAFGAKPWIIDPHTHFKSATQIEYERERVQRVPEDSLGRVVTPEDYAT